MPIYCQAALRAHGTLEPFEYEPTPLGPHDVMVMITHCGICHSDIHLIDDDWGVTKFPLVPGHEIVGWIGECGALVDRSRLVTRVGIGWQRSSCLECPSCLRGDEPSCSRNQATCVGHHGGFADRIVVDERFAFPIPDSIESEEAAPLLCGGVTVYSPLRRFGVDSAAHVGVVGIGGLGHLALQFASAMGCEVTAFSRSPNKEAHVRAFGAHRFILSTDHAAIRAAAGSLDFILSTVFVDLDWADYMRLLRPDGKLCIVGPPPGPIVVPADLLMFGHRSVCGSVIGGRATIGEMLEFAARHNIRAMTEAMPMEAAERAVDKLRANLARYRMVLKN